MLTAYQCEVGAYVTEDFEFFCEDCYNFGDVFARPMSNYELDEFQAEDSYECFRDAEGHAEDCLCLNPVLCVGCLGDIREAYTDTDCEEGDDEGSD